MFGRIFGRGLRERAAEGREAPASPSPGRECLVCARALTSTGPHVHCLSCGTAGAMGEACVEGHGICDACLEGRASRVILGVCALTEEKDPVAIASRLTLHPRLRLTLPEHELVVEGALLAAFSNVRSEGKERATRVAELATKAPGNPGPSGRGSAEAAGAFVTFAAELLGGAEGLSRRASDRARELIGEGEDALCPRRNALVSILFAARFAREHLSLELPARGLACERAGKNPTCVGAACPFNR